MLEQRKTDTRLAQLWQDYCTMVNNYTINGVLSPMYETIKWWHYVWDRIGDASFVYVMTGDKTAGEYVHSCVMDICKNKQEREWLCAWFRYVKENPPHRQLEMAHIS